MCGLWFRSAGDLPQLPHNMLGFVFDRSCRFCSSHFRRLRFVTAATAIIQQVTFNNGMEPTEGGRGEGGWWCPKCVSSSGPILLVSGWIRTLSQMPFLRSLAYSWMWLFHGPLIRDSCLSSIRLHLLCFRKFPPVAASRPHTPALGITRAIPVYINVAPWNCTHLTSLQLASVRRHGLVNSVNVEIKFPRFRSDASRVACSSRAFHLSGFFFSFAQTEKYRPLTSRHKDNRKTLMILLLTGKSNPFSLFRANWISPRMIRVFRTGYMLACWQDLRCFRWTRGAGDEGRLLFSSLAPNLLPTQPPSVHRITQHRRACSQARYMNAGLNRSACFWRRIYSEHDLVWWASDCSCSWGRLPTRGHHLTSHLTGDGRVQSLITRLSLWEGWYRKSTN